VIAYDNAVKESFLDVSPTLLQRHGAVSEEVVAAMADGVARRFGVPLGIAITGIAGPGGGTDAKPVGTVWVATSLDGRVEARQMVLPGSRDEIRMRAAQAALLLAWRRLRGRVTTPRLPD
jgi:nicotinamide-nucleotide amidase